MVRAASQPVLSLGARACSDGATTVRILIMLGGAQGHLRCQSREGQGACAFTLQYCELLIELESDGAPRTRARIWRCLG